MLAASYAQAGRIEDAEWEKEEVLILSPELTLADAQAMVQYAVEDHMSLYIDGLRKAGLPE